MLRYICKKIMLYVVRKFGVGSPFLKALSFVPVHYKDIVSWEPDVIQAHDLSTLPLAIKAANAIDKKKKQRNETETKVHTPVIFDSHELEAHRNPPLSRSAKFQVERMEKKYLKQCDFVTTVSKPLEQYIRKHYGIKNTGLIYNSPEMFPCKVHERWARRRGYSIRRDTGVTRKDFLFVSVGLITVNRGLEMALRAIEYLPGNVHFAALGPQNKNTVSDLRKLAHEMDVADRFHIIEPVLPTDVYRYISGADAAILPGIPATLSYEFSLPNKFFECSFAGLPLIASDLPEIKRLINIYGLGITYDALDVHDCAQKILEVYNHPAKYKRPHALVKQTIEKFSWERQADKLTKIVNNLIYQQGT